MNCCRFNDVSPPPSCAAVLRIFAKLTVKAYAANDFSVDLVAEVFLDRLLAVGADRPLPKPCFLLALPLPPLAVVIRR